MSQGYGGKGGAGIRGSRSVARNHLTGGRQGTVRNHAQGLRAYGFGVLSVAILLGAVAWALASFSTAPPGQKAWYWQNPYPQGNTLTRVSAGTSGLWAVGGPGIVLYSSDGGAVWDAQDPATTVTLRDVDFVDDNNGWVVGDAGTIRATSDGGSVWTTQTSGVAANRVLRGISMVDSSVGWAVGDVGITRKTTDGGATWVAQSNGTGQLNDVSAVDSDHAWAVGSAVGGVSTIRVTSDGGSTWTTQTVPTATNLLAVDFVDTQNGWAVGNTATVLKTTNGGSTWTTVAAGAATNVQDVEFVTPNIGWIVESNGTTTGYIRYTTNGGASWSLQMSGIRGVNGIAARSSTQLAAVGVSGSMLRTEDAGISWISQSAGTTRVLYGLSYVDSETAYAVGATGLVMRTEDGGDTWNSGTAGSGNWLAVDFADRATGWIVGVTGSIRKTVNGAETWAVQPSPTTQQLNSVAVASTQTAYAVGNGGTIIKTLNGGSTWTTQTSGITSNLLDVYFIDANTGWAVGNTGRIRKTTDGGATWVAQTSGVTSTLYSVHFVDANTGWVVGNTGVIRKTTDGGATWTAQTSGVTNALYSVSFTDANNGFAVGGVAGSPARLLRTTDGGATWTAQNANMTGILRAVERSNGVNGLAVGDAGSIRRTHDGGLTWIPQSYGTVNQLLDVVFIDGDNGWACGAGGTIMRTRDGGATWSALVSGVTTTLRGIDMVSATQGWVVGDSSVIRITSDGTNWTAQPSGTTVAFNGVDFVDASTGWSVGASATIKATLNGGSTWTTQTTGLTTSTPLWGVKFVDASNGWAWGGATGVRGLLLHTTDGGATWVQQDPQVATSVVLRTASFLDANTGWIAGTSGVIKKTTDGGSTWVTETVGSTAAIYGMDFIDANTGFHVGGAGGTTMSIIRRTADGGSTWTTQTPGTFNILYAVDFADADNGWVVGDGGTILKTTDPTPPITSMTVSPEDPDGTNGWYVTTPTVSLVPNEPCITYYSWVSTTGPWSTYSLPIERSTLGTSTLRYYSVDPGGNKEVVNSGVVRYDPDAPAAPAMPTASPIATDSVALAWPSVVDTVSGTSHYNVYVDGSLVTSSAAANATVSGLATETAYDFSVSAVDVAGNESTQSASVSAMTLAPLPRSPIAVYVRATQTQGVWVDWSESTGTLSPVSYRLYRAVAGGPFTAIATRTAEEARSVQDTSAPAFSSLEYRVSVVDARGEGELSAATALTSTSIDAIAPPIGLVARNTASVLLTWTPVPSPLVYGYHVYRSGTSTATPETQTVTPIVDASYHDTSTAEYTEYWYRVATVDTSGNVGVPSAPVYIRTEASGTVEPPHGSYTTDTDFCALCHAVHTSPSPQRLAQPPGSEITPTPTALLRGTTTIDAPLCLSCHDGTSASNIMSEYDDASRESSHPVSIDGTQDGLFCASCHAVHDSETTGTVKGLLSAGGEKSGNPFCYACHGEATAVPRGDLHVFEASAHGTGVVEPPTGTKVICLSCHVSHSTRDASLYPYNGDDRCLGCHSTGVFGEADGDVAGRLTGADSGTRHNLLVADATTTGSRLTCANCHEPHTATATTPCVDPYEPTTAGGMDASGSAFCLSCHDGDLPTSADTSGWVEAPLAEGGSSVTTDIASMWTTNVHGDGASVSPSLRADMAYEAGDSLGCAACHDPHGSQNRYALRDSVSSQGDTMSVDAILVVPAGTGYDFRFLCAACHELTAASHPGPGLGGADLSSFPIDCTASGCHTHAGSGL